MAGEAPGGPTWETGGVMTPDELRIKLRGVWPPEPAEAVEADEVTGRPPAQFVPRSGEDGFTSHLVFDRFGVRYFDRTLCRGASGGTSGCRSSADWLRSGRSSARST